MRDNWSFGFTTGVAIMTIIVLIILHLVGARSADEIVSHGCAHYDHQTGDFTWNDEVKTLTNQEQMPCTSQALNEALD